MPGSEATPDAAIAGQLDVDQIRELVVRDEHGPGVAKPVAGELAAPDDEVAEAFAATLVARPQTRLT